MTVVVVRENDGFALWRIKIVHVGAVSILALLLIEVKQRIRPTLVLVIVIVVMSSSIISGSIVVVVMVMV